MDQTVISPYQTAITPGGSECQPHRRSIAAGDTKWRLWGAQKPPIFMHIMGRQARDGQLRYGRGTKGASCVRPVAPARLCYLTESALPVRDRPSPATFWRAVTATGRLLAWGVSPGRRSVRGRTLRAVRLTTDEDWVGGRLLGIGPPRVRMTAIPGQDRGSPLTFRPARLRQAASTTIVLDLYQQANRISVGTLRPIPVRDRGRPLTPTPAPTVPSVTGLLLQVKAPLPLVTITDRQRISPNTGRRVLTGKGRIVLEWGRWKRQSLGRAALDLEAGVAQPDF